MTYDFTTLMDRKGKDAVALDVEQAISGGNLAHANVKIRDGFSVIPMWVADMNFPTVPTIIEELQTRVAHPAFGYFRPTKAYFDSIIDWHRDRYGITAMKAENIGYENGVLGGVVNALNVLCSKGDRVLIHSPTYIGFNHCLQDNGYNLIRSPLKLDENGIWRMDYEDMEAKIREHKIHAAVFCSPHNPTGRVWERWEIEKAMALFAKYDVYVVSDEIWADLVTIGYQHIPTQSVSEDAKMRTIAMYAPSKTFNLAGLIGSYHVIYNPWLKDRVDREARLSHYNGMNVLSMHALIGAYKPEGRVWLDELREVLTDNINYAYDFITTHFKGVKLAKPQGTYMLFLDCTEWCAEHGKTLDELEITGMEVGVIWWDGRAFNHPCAIRMNLALPHSQVIEAFNRLDRYVFNAH